jgi:hypothetical protein
MRKLRGGNITGVPVKNATLEKLKKAAKNGKTTDWRYYMIEKLRKILWHIGIIESCPSCGKNLKVACHMKEDGWQYYECINPMCDFGKTEKKQ